LQWSTGPAIEDADDVFDSASSDKYELVAERTESRGNQLNL
jgi:hypothetical protein